MGAIAAGVDADTRECLDRFADALGLAFQVRDDLLDVEGDSATLGKTAGKDAEQDKSTFHAQVGVQASHERLRAPGQEMDQALAGPCDKAGQPQDWNTVLMGQLVLVRDGKGGRARLRRK